MNIHPRDVGIEPNEQDVELAMDTLRRWVAAASEEQLQQSDTALLARILPYPVLSVRYDTAFSIDDAYKASMPDLQNGPSALIKGSHKRIQHVGISNFRLPLSYTTRGGSIRLLETSVTGSVSLEADKKGINMSRIMRSFYKHAEDHFSFDVIDAALDDYLTDLESLDARLQLGFSFPMKVESLRSGLSGYQYYDVALEMVVKDGVRTRIIHLDYVYSSTCPCSLELSEHARRERGQLATPHSQRSVARLSIALRDGEQVYIEDLIEHCRKAVPTETQVMVKREDEQAFAELNAANPIFVEDAARLFCEQLENDARIGDFRVVASHQESLHSHDAISILTQGEMFESTSYEPKLFQTLIHTR